MLTDCREFRHLAIEMARRNVTPDERRRVNTHAKGCVDCARALEDHIALSGTFHRMASETFPEMAGIEQRVLAKFDRSVAKRRVFPSSRWALIAGLAAALLVGIVWIERPRTGPVATPPVKTATVQAPSPAAVRVPPPVPVERKRASSLRKSRPAKLPPVEAEQPFLSIPYTVPVGPDERTTMVRMEIPVAALIAAGFSVPASDTGSVVEADVLVSADGRARAIRPLIASQSQF